MARVVKRSSDYQKKSLKSPQITLSSVGKHQATNYVDGNMDGHSQSLPTPSPSCCASLGDIVPTHGSLPRPDEMTHRGLEMTLAIHRSLEAEGEDRTRDA